MNIVLENAIEHIGKETNIELGTAVIRGNAIVMWECLEKVN